MQLLEYKEKKKIPIDQTFCEKAKADFQLS